MIYMNNLEFAMRLEAFCKDSFKTKAELALRLGIRPQALQKYLSGERLPMPEFFVRLSSLGCNIDWLITGDGEMLKSEASEPKRNTLSIPVLAEVECGTPVYMQINNYPLKYIDVADSKHFVNPFIAVARGDSMRPYINPGDYLVCSDEPNKIKDGSAVVVNFISIPETYSTNAKLIRYLPGKRIMLYSINTKYPPSIHKPDEIYKIYKVVRIIRDVK